MKRILIVFCLAMVLNASVCVSDADATFWFWLNPNRALIWLTDCWLEDTNQCVECRDMDLDKNGIVNWGDFAEMVR